MKIGVGFVLHETHLEIVGSPSFEDWQACGRELARLGSSSAWGLGDWLVYGEGRGDWGEKYSQAMSETGKSYDSLVMFASTSKAFELPRRRGNLSHSHHREIGALDAAAADKILDAAESEKLSSRDVRALVRGVRREIKATNQLWPEDRYGVIYADPPWEYEHVKTDSRAIENQYPTMDLEEIKALRVADLAADDCVLYLWTTSPKLDKSLEVIDAWGFTYRSCMVWVKDIMGMGYWARQRHELLLIAVKGAPLTPDESVRPDSVIQAPRAEHSEKPAEVYDLLDTLYGERPIVELFARASDARPARWATWGNDPQALTQT